MKIRRQKATWTSIGFVLALLTGNPAVADDTELPRLVDEALDRALRICRAVAREDDNVALAFSQLGDRRARAGLTSLLHRRIVAPDILSKYLVSTIYP